LLKSLAIWSLSSSEAVQAKIKESYKQARHDDDLNQPLSVQPWGRDGLKRRYWLIEGMDDTHFRLYRESNPALKTVTWWSVAGSIPELRGIAEKLGEERSTNSKKLRDKINVAIPRFEASEEVSPSCGPLVALAYQMKETKASRLPTCSKSCVHSTGARLLALRGPHAWKEAQVYLR
jgi:hypothetical protein